MQSRLKTVIKDPVWLKVTTLTITLFFLFLSDAILAFWVPNFLSVKFADEAKVGLIIAFSSLIGLGADIILPQLIRGVSVRRLIFFSIVFSFIFSLTLLGNTYMPFILVSLISMAVWGIYYEFMCFAQQQFVSDSTPLKLHASAWGFLGVFKALAYLIGPIISASFWRENLQFPLYLGLTFSFLSFISLNIMGKENRRKIDIEPSKVNLMAEMGHWKALFARVWPIVLLSLIFGVIDSFYWTVGAVWMEELSVSSFWGKLFLSAYTAPSLFMGFVVAKWGLYKGKKKMSIKFFILSSLILMTMPLVKSVFLIVVIVFISSALLSISYPLLEGVYSDIVSRMGRERSHLIGLVSSSRSIAYIVGPVLAGFIAKMSGVGKSFSIMAIGSLIIGIFLLLVTPKKIKVPQSEIKNWND